MPGIYDNVKSIAKEKKVPVCLIEKTAGLATGSVCKWNTVSPSVNSIKKVADLLGVTVDDLINNRGD